MNGGAASSHCTSFRLWHVPGTLAAPAAAPARPGRRQTETVLLAITLLGGEVTERWRRRLHAENRDYVIVFVGAHYGIFHMSAFAVLAGQRLKGAGIPPPSARPPTSSPATVSAH